MRNYAMLFALILFSSLSVGCSSQDVPQAHKGRMFDKTGAFAFYSGGDGFTGAVLGPGTYWTGIYDEVKMIDCSQETIKEPLESLTKDGVQFKLDVYITFSADCSDKTVQEMLATLSADKGGNVITGQQLYNTYVRPAIGEAVRESISPVRANDINDQREVILKTIRERFVAAMSKEDRKKVVIFDTVLSNLDYPEEMDHANTERAVQGVLKDKAIAERERVEAETKTMDMRIQLAKKEGEVEAAKIDQVGAALRRNPEYLQFDIQNKMPEIYKQAGASGNLVIAAPSPQLILTPKATVSK